MSLDLIKEGSIRFYASLGDISKKLEVFYNPKMKLNRDITILLLKVINRDNLKIGLPLSGSGVRGIRILKELCNKVDKVLFNDINPYAYKAIKKNIEINKVDISKTEVYNKDASLFLLEKKYFDYIDIDPFGSPNPYLDASVKSINKNGIIAVTATDLAPLSGRYIDTCIRKYWAKPLKCYLKHEIGLRILIRKVQLIGLQYEKALIPILSYFKDHYYRIFFLVKHGKEECNDIISKYGYICFKNDLEFEVCNERISERYAGPLWLGPIKDHNLIEKMIKELEDINENKELREFLLILSEELSIVGYYSLHEIAKKFKINTPKRDKIINLIREKYNIECSRTHFNYESIKTKLPLKNVIEEIKKLA